jgi:hypothetical protein
MVGGTRDYGNPEFGYALVLSNTCIDKLQKEMGRNKMARKQIPTLYVLCMHKVRRER